MTALDLPRPPEEWRAITGYENLYEVSNHGRVRSLDRTIEVTEGKRGTIARRLKGRVLAPQKNGNGYLHVFLCSERGKAVHRIASLVAVAFIGPRPLGQEVCHCDGVKDNNRADNLRYDTRKANHADKIAHGTSSRGTRHGLAKLTDDDVRAIRKLRGVLTGRATAARFGISPATVCRALSGCTWGHVMEGDK